MNFSWNLTRGTGFNCTHQLPDNIVCRLYAKYSQKMNSYSQKVNDIEHSHELYQQVVILQEGISKANSQSTIFA